MYDVVSCLHLKCNILTQSRLPDTLIFFKVTRNLYAIDLKMNIIPIIPFNFNLDRLYPVISFLFLP